MTNQAQQQEEVWQAQDDARTLAKAKEVKADAERLAKAIAAAQAMLEEKKEDVKYLNAIAKMKTSKNNMALVKQIVHQMSNDVLYKI